MNEYFPYDEIRKGQDSFIKIAKDIIENKRHLLVHAPTGIGKTVAALVPALQYSLRNKKRIVFVTPRHQQHKIVIDTIKSINNRWNTRISITDFLGRQKMCNMDVSLLSSTDFNAFCKHHRENKTCPFYNKTYKDKKTTPEADILLKELHNQALYGEDLKERSYKFCPYEINVELGKKTDVIVADYYHIFSPRIREHFLKRLNTKLDDIILIVDEAHNLPSRARSLFSSRTSFYQINRVKEELKDYNKNISKLLDSINKDLMKKFRNKNNMKINGEFLVEKTDFTETVNKYIPYNDLLDELYSYSDIIHEKKERSFVSGLTTFLELWSEEDSSLVRLVNLDEKGFKLSLECLDPSIITKDVFEEVHSSVCMSATLLPLEMYSDLLQIPNPAKLQLKSPFPKENKISIILDNVTTKFSMRNEEEYKNISEELIKLSEIIPGNIGVFFPSYYIRDEILRLIREKVNKHLFIEIQGSTTEQKNKLMEDFKKASENGGGILMAVVGANFSEGVDFKGEWMNGVILVGLPLDRPDLLTKSLINYYQNKFKKGWEYGYTYPAMNKAIQAMGRCIRSEKDKGVIVLMDARYKERRYRNLLPSDYEFIEKSDEKIKELFKEYIKPKTTSLKGFI